MKRSTAVDPWDLGFRLAVKGENRLPPRHVAGRLGGQRVARGLAIRRSNAVKASISSGASKTRLRRPTLT